MGRLVLVGEIESGKNHECRIVDFTFNVMRKQRINCNFCYRRHRAFTQQQ